MAKRWEEHTADLGEGIPDSVHDFIPEREAFPADDQPVPEPADLTAYELFDVLSNRRRWYAVYFFQHYTTAVELGALATQIAAWENDVDRSEVSGTERKRVYTSLQQVHLPKMNDLGVLEFDKRSGQIKAAPFVTDIELDPGSSDERGPSLSRYYVALATAHGALVIMFLAEIWPLASVPMSVEIVAFVLSFALVTTVHLYGAR